MILGTDREPRFSATALDTAPFIYLIEKHPVYADLVRPILSAASRGECRLVTSSVTLLEVLVLPYRLGNGPLAARYEELLSGRNGLEMVSIDSSQLRLAAQLRARYQIKTPDALQIAAALSAECSTFITNDRRLPAIPGLHIVQLSDLR